MLHQKRTNIIGEWAQKGEVIRKGDRIEILSEGREIVSQFKDKNGNDQTQTVFSIKTRNGAKNIPLNQTSINSLVEEFGEDDKNWIGKIVNVLVVIIPGKPSWYYFAPDGYEIGEQGLVKIGAQPAPNDEIPIINLDEEEIDPNDVPF